MKTPPEVPMQYRLLPGLLCEWSASYHEQLGKLWTDHGDAWNPRTSRFEVDVYFTFLLSRSLLGHKHERQVWEDMYWFCEATLVAVHGGKVLCEDLVGVILARFDEYGGIANSCAESGDADISIKATERLRQHIMASSRDDRVEKNPPWVICDIFADLPRRSAHLRIDWFFAGSFGCALKHICHRTNDLRTLSEEEFRSLVQAGEQEAIPLAKEMSDVLRSSEEELYAKLGALANDPPVEAKRWWQFWR